jgi:hypothetical protein
LYNGKTCPRYQLYIYLIFKKNWLMSNVATPSNCRLSTFGRSAMRPRVSI